MVASREYMTSVVVGKDVVARLGLHQMETLRHDLIATVRTSKKNKVNRFQVCHWKMTKSVRNKL